MDRDPCRLLLLCCASCEAADFLLPVLFSSCGCHGDTAAARLTRRKSRAPIPLSLSTVNDQTIPSISSRITQNPLLRCCHATRLDPAAAIDPRGIRTPPLGRLASASDRPTAAAPKFRDVDRPRPCSASDTRQSRLGHRRQALGVSRSWRIMDTVAGRVRVRRLRGLPPSANTRRAPEDPRSSSSSSTISIRTDMATATTTTETDTTRATTKATADSTTTEATSRITTTRDPGAEDGRCLVAEGAQ